MSRLIRAMRVVRVIRFIRALRIMLFTIWYTLKSMIWAVLLMTMVIYFFAIIFTQSLAVHPYDPEDAAVDMRRKSAPTETTTYWGTLGTSMLTLLESAIGGVDWKDPLQPLAEVHWSLAAMFLGYIVFTYFALLNVVTAAFCTTQMEGHHYDRDATVKELISNKESDLHKTVDLFSNMILSMDVDGSGKISWDEFSDHLEDSSVQALLALLDMNTKDLYSLFNLLCDKNAVDIDATQFVSGCMHLKGPARSIDLAQFSRRQKKLCDQFDKLERLVKEDIQELRASRGYASSVHNGSGVSMPRRFEGGALLAGG